MFTVPFAFNFSNRITNVIKEKKMKINNTYDKYFIKYQHYISFAVFINVIL